MAVDYNELLYEKVQAEYDNFIEALKQMAPEQIIERAYEKVIKENIVTVIQLNELSISKAEALFCEKYTLDHLYQEWLNTNVSKMQILKDFIDDTDKDIAGDILEW